MMPLRAENLRALYAVHKMDRKPNEKEPESVHLEARKEQQKNLPVSDGKLLKKFDQNF